MDVNRWLWIRGDAKTFSTAETNTGRDALLRATHSPAAKHLLRVPFLWAPLRACTNPRPLICSAIILKAGEETASVRNKEALAVNHSTWRKSCSPAAPGRSSGCFFIKRSVVVNQPSLSFRGKIYTSSVFVGFIITLGKDSRIFPLIWRQNRLNEAFIRAVLVSPHLPLWGLTDSHSGLWKISFSLRQRNVFNVFNL